MFKKFLISTFVFIMFAFAAQALAYDFGSASLRVGSRGEYVKTLQTLVGATPADGVFGPMTKAKVMAWQKANGLVADGIFGPASMAKANGAVSGNFPVGCTSASGFSITTGNACDSEHANTFPVGCTNASGFSVTTGFSCSGAPLPVARGGGSTSPTRHTVKVITDAGVALSHGSVIFGYTFDSGENSITYADAKKAPYYLDTDASTVTLKSGEITTQAYLKDLNISDTGTIEYSTFAEIQEDFTGILHLVNVPDQVILHLVGAADVNSGKNEWTKDVTIDLTLDEQNLIVLVGRKSTAVSIVEADYTVNSYADLTDALALPETNAGEISDKIDAINNALYGLVYLGQADLDDAVAEAEDLTASDYTTLSWGVLTEALALPELSNAQVVAKTDAIYDAIDGLISTDATLAEGLVIKGTAIIPDQNYTLAELLGTPSATISGILPGTVYISQSDAGSLVLPTHFDTTNANATVKAVKYAFNALDPTAEAFASITAYNNEAITDLEFFIVRVTAHDASTILYYKIIVSAPGR